MNTEVLVLKHQTARLGKGLGSVKRLIGVDGGSREPLSHLGFSRLHFLVLAFALLYPAIKAAGTVAADSGRKDPQVVVIDEVLGQWLTLAGALRFDFPTLALAFALFRLFDIWKPWPIRRLEQLPEGTGIMLDDVAAGILALAIGLLLARWF